VADDVEPAQDAHVLLEIMLIHLVHNAPPHSYPTMMTLQAATDAYAAVALEQRSSLQSASRER
jgi:hypothetical protein